MSTQPKTQTATGSLVAALAELDNVKANKINPAFKAKYVSLDALLDAIKPVLLDHDLALIQTLVSEDGKVGVSTAFLHASGERFDFGKLMVKADGLTAQQIGGALGLAVLVMVANAARGTQAATSPDALQGMVNAQYGAALFAALGVVIALGLRPTPVDSAATACLSTDA